METILVPLINVPAFIAVVAVPVFMTFLWRCGCSCTIVLFCLALIVGHHVFSGVVVFSVLSRLFFCLFVSLFVCFVVVVVVVVVLVLLFFRCSCSCCCCCLLFFFVAVAVAA